MVYQRGQEVFRDPKPFSYTIYPKCRKVVCDSCLKLYPDEGILKVCTKCNLVYYCGRKCQKDAWKSHHKLECEYLENMPSEIDVAFNEAENLPNEDGVHEIQMIFLNVLKTTLKLDQNGEEEFFQLPNCKKRYFTDLMSHCDDFVQSLSENGMTRLYFVYEQCRLWLGDKAPSYDKKLFNIISIWNTNSHVLLDSEKSDTKIGTALYLGASCIDHSCDPNVEVWNNGKEVIINTTREVANFSELRMSYLERELIMKSSVERKERLRLQHFFDCKCTRCEDPDSDAKLFSLKCKNCVGWVHDKTKICTICNQKLELNEQELAIVEKYKNYALPLDNPASTIKEIESFYKRYSKLFHPFHGIFGTFCVFVYDYQSMIFTRPGHDDNLFVEMFKVMLDHCKEHLSEFSNLSGTLNRVIGHAYLYMKAYDQAEIHLKKAEEIMNVILISGHPRVEIFQSWKSDLIHFKMAQMRLALRRK